MINQVHQSPCTLFCEEILSFFPYTQLLSIFFTIPLQKRAPPCGAFLRYRNFRSVSYNVKMPGSNQEPGFKFAICFYLINIFFLFYIMNTLHQFLQTFVVGMTYYLCPSLCMFFSKYRDCQELITLFRIYPLRSPILLQYPDCYHFPL